MKSDVIDLKVFIHGESDMAIRVGDTRSAADAVWLPKSQIEIDNRRYQGGSEVCDVQVPEWLASKKGLV